MEAVATTGVAGGQTRRGSRGMPGGLSFRPSVEPRRGQRAADFREDPADPACRGSAGDCPHSRRRQIVLRTLMVWLSCLLLLTSCAVALDGRAAVQAAADEARQSFLDCRVRSGPEVKLVKPFADGVIGLYTFECDGDGPPMTESGIVYVRQRGLRWISDGGAGGMRPSANFPLVDVISGGGGRDDAQWTYAGGLVRDPAVRKVAVSYADGVREVVPVENGAYLAARDNAQPVTKVEALDEHGRFLYDPYRFVP